MRESFRSMSQPTQFWGQSEWNPPFLVGEVAQICWHPMFTPRSTTEKRHRRFRRRRWARSWASRGWKFRTLRDNFPNIFPSDWTFVPLCPNVVLDYLLRISCIHFLQYTIYNVYTHIQNIHTHEQEFEYRPSNRHLVLTVFDFLRGADGLCGGLSSHS